MRAADGHYVSDIPHRHSSDPEGSFPQCSLLDRRIDAVRELAFGFLVTRPRLVERNVRIRFLARRFSVSPRSGSWNASTDPRLAGLANTDRRRRKAFAACAKA